MLGHSRKPNDHICFIDILCISTIILVSFLVPFECASNDLSLSFFGSACWALHYYFFVL